MQRGEIVEDRRTGARLELVLDPSQTPDGSLTLRRTLPPGVGLQAPHVHDDVDEDFAFEAGVGRMMIGRRRLQVGPGSRVTVAARQHHFNPYNPRDADEELRFRQTWRPATDFLLAFFDTLADVMQRSATTRFGDVPLLLAFAVAHETDSQTYATG